MKFFGILCLSMIPIRLSLSLCEDMKRKQNLRKNLLLFFQHILFEIENFNREQKIIFEKFENPILKKSGFLDELLDEVNSAPCGAFGRVMQKHLPSFGFSRQISDVLLTVGEHFGTQAKNRQIEELEELISLLKTENEKEKTETENKIRITRMVGLTAGIGILILML